MFCVKELMLKYECPKWDQRMKMMSLRIPSKLLFQSNKCFEILNEAINV